MTETRPLGRSGGNTSSRRNPQLSSRKWGSQTVSGSHLSFRSHRQSTTGRKPSRLPLRHRRAQSARAIPPNRSATLEPERSNTPPIPPGSLVRSRNASSLGGLTDTDKKMLQHTPFPPMRPYQGAAISEWTCVREYGDGEYVRNNYGKATRRTWGGDPVRTPPHCFAQAVELELGPGALIGAWWCAVEPAAGDAVVRAPRQPGQPDPPARLIGTAHSRFPL